jgi:DNA uptake protein ComE-like DNA-binding protein
MGFRGSTPLLTLAVLFAGATTAMAETAPKAATQAEGRKPAGRAARAAKRQAPANVKLIDINGASKAELLTLPSIDATLADKIIAGRPYGSKSHLLTRNILPGMNYDAVKARVVARQPFADAAKNAEVIAKARKKN